MLKTIQVVLICIDLGYYLSIKFEFMKKLINLIVKSITLYGIQKMYNSDPDVEASIKGHYIKGQRETFVVSSDIVRVKKGKRKYSLLFVEGADGVMRFNLGGRHIQRNKGVLNFSE